MNNLEEKPNELSTGLSKDVKQAVYLVGLFPSVFVEACKMLKIDPSVAVESYDDQTAAKVYHQVSVLNWQKQNN